MSSLTEPLAWSLLLRLAHWARSAEPVSASCYICFDTGNADAGSGDANAVAGDAVAATASSGTPLRTTAAKAWLELNSELERGWRALRDVEPAAQQLLDLYVPLCIGPLAKTLSVAHLGQSLDGYIALKNGESRYVTNAENLRHLHRMRALFDAVVVGRNTVECDDPRLTTRLVSGTHPARVVLDPARRLAPNYNVFNDGMAPTWLVCAASAASAGAAPGHATLIPLAEGVSAPNVLAALHARGLRRVFVEGGGLTVSSFLQSGALDRLQITVAPLLIGAGRPGVCVPEVAQLEQALRPRCTSFALGNNVLFDCELPRAGRA